MVCLSLDAGNEEEVVRAERTDEPSVLMPILDYLSFRLVRLLPRFLRMLNGTCLTKENKKCLIAACNEQCCMRLPAGAHELGHF